MFEDYQICPYTGLRSFTEEESLYFKGREEHIAMATEQLQRQKFLMLTGASGDGKSSLVYAGIIPNARAGFLKSKFSQWCVADFRPERTPFRNLAHAVAKQLDIPNPATAESELQHGFSALADLYKNSALYPDMESDEWQRADEQQRNALRRKAANLIILVDQFEEFFTNPENYHRGVPSRDSNLVLNLLLETARIALEQDLPIYVIFTMRSDYIGQCAAFRSLPEYIGFSQFFVPRLNRTQLQQVIEEPATLSGNRITRRLTERLIHDIAEGVDQLPILQHALNQIWHAAAKGKEEMDLIHYAMVGGMSPSELPDDQVTRFKSWFDTLPAKIKEFYREPNLQNVLDTHANKLYESAAESYRVATGTMLSDDTTKAIIKTAFTCLTKIDQSRAVRNRMTLAEITHVLNRPDISTDTVGKVLQGFREPGNTFIRPFVTDDPESSSLHPDDVLDITHESLIRNWEYLEAWANEEFDNYTISLDFEKQLNRWVDSGKSNGFLLSIGPLTYFEGWYRNVKPNAWWIARYLPEDIDQPRKLEKAGVILGHADEFIRRSIRKHLVTRTVMKYGPGRIAAGLAIIGLLVLSSFAASNFFKRQNGYILKSMKAEIYQLAQSPKVNFYDKSTLLIEQILSGNSTLGEILDHIPDTLTKTYVASRVAGFFAFFGQGQPAGETLSAIRQAEHYLSAYPYTKANAQQLAAVLNNSNHLRNGVALASVYNDTSELHQLSTRVATISGNLAMHIYTAQPEGFQEINQLNAALENAIHFKTLEETDRKQLLQILSPFENKQRSPWVLKAYAMDNLAERGNYNYGYKFNGLYQELAYLYAAEGNSNAALQCVDSLLAYNQNYFSNDYGAMMDNATNIAMVFHAYDQLQALDVFIEGYSARKKINIVEFYQRLLGRNLVGPTLTSDLNEFGGGGLRNLNCQLSDEPTLAFLFERYRKAIQGTIRSNNELNLLLALSYKDEAIFRGNLRILKGNREMANLFRKLDTAFVYYQRIDPAYLREEVRIANTNDIDVRPALRNFSFLYPDYRPGFSIMEPRNIEGSYTSAFFIEYVLQANVLDQYYSDQELAYFTDWFESIELDRDPFVNGSDAVCFAPDDETLQRLEATIKKRGSTGNADLNLLYFHLAHKAIEGGDITDGLSHYNAIDPSRLFNLLRSPNANMRTSAFLKIARAVTDLAGMDSLQSAHAFVRQFKNPINRSSLYAFAAVKLLEQNINRPMSSRLLDSAKTELNRITNLATGQPNRQIIAHALAMQNPEQNAEAAFAIIKNIGNKLDPTYRICRSFAFHGNLYGAKQQFLDNLSDQDHANFIWNILYGYRQGQQNTPLQWRNWTDNYVFFKTQTLNYINEAN